MHAQWYWYYHTQRDGVREEIDFPFPCLPEWGDWKVISQYIYPYFKKKKKNLNKVQKLV